jgi:hypothetical protein
MDLRAAELVCGKIERVEKDLKRVPALVFETIKAYEARATIRFFRPAKNSSAKEGGKGELGRED